MIVGLINGRKVPTIHVSLVIHLVMTVMALLTTNVVHETQDTIYSPHQITLLALPHAQTAL